MDTIDIASLTTEQRLELLEQIWDSLAATPESVPITPAQRQELDRRLDDLDKNPEEGSTWDEVRARIWPAK